MFTLQTKDNYKYNYYTKPDNINTVGCLFFEGYKFCKKSKSTFFMEIIFIFSMGHHLYVILAYMLYFGETIFV